MRASFYSKQSVYKLGTVLLASIGLSQSKFNVCSAEQRKNRVYSWGSSTYYQTGIGANHLVKKPELVSISADLEIVDIDCNEESSLVLTKNGKLYSFGRGENYRLGHGTESNEIFPRLVRELDNEKVFQFSVGAKHCAAVTEKGELWSWGHNDYGQLGRDFSKEPRKIENLKNVKKVSCGKTHTLAVTHENKVYSCGEGGSAALGHGNRSDVSDMKLIEALEKEKIVDIVAGEDYSLFLSAEGKVFSCGASDYGQTGLGQHVRYHLTPTFLPSLTNIKSITGKYLHNIAISEDGTAFVWGFNKTGQLGLGDTFHRFLPCKLGFDGETSQNQRSLIVESAGTGAKHSAVIAHGLGAKKIFVFGDGRYGQLGRGDCLESGVAYRDHPVEITQFLPGCTPLKVALGKEHTLCLCKPE